MGARACASSDAGGAGATTTWALVPVNPKEETPASGAVPTAAELANSKRLMRLQVKLNVGGENFHTTFSTLLKCEYFQRLLPTRVDSNTERFFSLCI